LQDVLQTLFPFEGGVTLNFQGKRSAHEIYRKVWPRQTIIKEELSLGTDEEQARNMIVEGENLQAMVTLYKERGQVDLITTGPPYNTGRPFATTTNGTAIRTIQSSARSSGATTAPSTPNG
jgi:hypothetical protein